MKTLILGDGLYAAFAAKVLTEKRLPFDVASISNLEFEIVKSSDLFGHDYKLFENSNYGNSKYYHGVTSCLAFEDGNLDLIKNLHYRIAAPRFELFHFVPYRVVRPKHLFNFSKQNYLSIKNIEQLRDLTSVYDRVLCCLSTVVNHYLINCLFSERVELSNHRVFKVGVVSHRNLIKVLGSTQFVSRSLSGTFFRNVRTSNGIILTFRPSTRDRSFNFDVDASSGKLSAILRKNLSAKKVTSALYNKFGLLARANFYDVVVQLPIEGCGVFDKENFVLGFSDVNRLNGFMQNIEREYGAVFSLFEFDDIVSNSIDGVHWYGEEIFSKEKFYFLNPTLNKVERFHHPTIIGLKSIRKYI